MDLVQATYLILLGFAAGFINVLAGGGSMLVVPFLILIGLPANVANATNRVAIFLQNIISVNSFRQHKILDLKASYKILPAVLLGSITGSLTAVDINEDILQKIIAGLLMLMFFMVLSKPDKWIKAQANKVAHLPPYLRFLLFFAIGFYGGFIQIGVGFFLLAALVLGCGLDLLKANAVKVLIVLFYTLFSLLIFIGYNLVEWETGLILACGNMAGAWTGTRFGIKWGNKYLRYILLAALAIVSLKLSGIF